MQKVKLADVLGKFIIPVSFLENWPPKCLAIQFATTQYIDWKTQTQINAGTCTCTFSNKELHRHEDEIFTRLTSKKFCILKLLAIS